MNMTDQEIVQTIHDILVQLHDPKHGVNGHANKLFAMGVGKSEYQKARADKLNQIVAKYGLTPADRRDVKMFRMSGRDVVQNNYAISCGHWARAVCYLNNKLPTDKRMELRIMMTTQINHLSDGMVGHTIPCVRMSDGKWHAFEPQNNPVNTGHVDFLDADIVVGNVITHLMPELAKSGDKYKIVAIVTPEYYESHLSDFWCALDVFRGKLIRDKMKFATVQIAQETNNKSARNRPARPNQKNGR